AGVTPPREGPGTSVIAARAAPAPVTANGKTNQSRAGKQIMCRLVQGHGTGLSGVHKPLIQYHIISQKVGRTGARCREASWSFGDQSGRFTIRQETAPRFSLALPAVCPHLELNTYAVELGRGQVEWLDFFMRCLVVLGFITPVDFL